MVDDIVNQTFLEVQKSPGFHTGLHNFGYMSKACIRTAYKVFHKNDRDSGILTGFDLTAPLIDEDNFVDEIEQADDTAFILASLQTLKQIEQIIITERYYSDFSFREISKRHRPEITGAATRSSPTRRGYLPTSCSSIRRSQDLTQVIKTESTEFQSLPL